MVGVNVDDDFVFFIVKEGVFFILIDVDILDFSDERNKVIINVSFCYKRKSMCFF